MTKKFYVVALLVVLGITTVGAAYAAFVGKSKILGTSVSVGSADIKLLKDVAGGISAENLVAEKAGPALANIYPGWKQDYLVKLHNNSAAQVSLTSNANYVTDQDPAALRQLLYVQPIPWSDNNSNGLVELDELGTPLERKTIVKWKTEGYNLGNLASGQTMGLVLRFSADSIPDTKQGTSGVFDFEFNSIGQ